MDEIRKNEVFILPDVLSWIPKRFRGAWMLNQNFPFQIVFDKRSKEKQALAREKDQPHICASYSAIDYYSNNSAVYHLPKQQTILYCFAFHDKQTKLSKAIIAFYDDADPFYKKREDVEIPIKEADHARTTMMRDLRT